MINPVVTITLMAALYCNVLFAGEIDDKLSLVIQVYNLTAKKCGPNFQSTPEMVEAGRVAFESKSLSGNRDTSCRTCHLDEFGTADGLPIAVGVGGNDEKGQERLSDSSGVLVQRNAFSLRGRSDPQFIAYFWDGKAQLQDGKIITQIGENLPKGFNSLLSAAAILPLMERDEFIGRKSYLSPNLIEKKVGDEVYYRKFMMVSQAIFERLSSPKTDEDRKLLEALKGSGVTLSPTVLVDIGNRLAAFIDSEFQCQISPWDKYLSGDPRSLTPEQKKGALIFYGKGRCAACHAGPFHSDFEFHSIGTPQGAFGPHSRHRDIGRASVTHKTHDLYLFRTPPLNNIATTAPYGHSGVFPDLESVILHHFNPIDFYLQNPAYREHDKYIIGKLLASRNDVLTAIDISTDSDLKALVLFLHSL